MKRLAFSALLAATCFTAPAMAQTYTGPENYNGKFAFIGDWGDGPGSAQVAAHVKAFQPGIIGTVGDNCYDVGTHAGQQMKHYGDYITAKKMRPSPGNHDVSDCDGLAGYKRLYNYLPNGGVTYSFTYGPVFFISIASQKDLRSATGAQAQWVKAQLASPAAKAAKHRIVYFHHPAWSSGEHESTEEMRWPFEAWGATAVLNGHDHNDERVMRDDNGDGRQIPYYVIGLGGHGRDPIPNKVAGSVFRFTGDWSAMFGTISPDGNSVTLQMRQVTGNKVTDTYTLGASAPPPPTPDPVMKTCPDGTVIPVAQTCPPSPPPPPPTKVCPDGSVVLATLPCPTPPPPPPPDECDCPEEPPPPPPPPPPPGPVPTEFTQPSGIIRPANGVVVENFAYRKMGGIMFQIADVAGKDNITIRNGRVDGPYELLRMGGGGAISNITLQNIRATRIRRSCVWAQGTGGGTSLTVDGLECLADPAYVATSMSDLREGMAVHTAWSKVTIRNSIFRGFKMQMPDGAYGNGDGLALERPVTEVVLENIVSTDNTDGGFDIKANMTGKNLYGARNYRNFRFWGNAVVDKVQCFMWHNSCVWGNGKQTGDPQTVEIGELIAYNDKPSNQYQAILLGASNGVRVKYIIGKCDFRGPVGLTIKKGIHPDSVLGPGCDVVKPYNGEQLPEPQVLPANMPSPTVLPEEPVLPPAPPLEPTPERG